MHYKVGKLVNPDLIVLTHTTSVGRFIGYKNDKRELWFGPRALSDRESVQNIVAQLRYEFAQKTDVSDPRKGKRVGRAKVSDDMESED